MSGLTVFRSSKPYPRQVMFENYKVCFLNNIAYKGIEGMFDLSIVLILWMLCQAIKIIPCKFFPKSQTEDKLIFYRFLGDKLLFSAYMKIKHYF